MTESERPFSDHPYSDFPTAGRAHVRTHGTHSEIALGVLCAEAQADGVPCWELGRDCETCERAYRWLTVLGAEQSADD